MINYNLQRHLGGLTIPVRPTTSAVAPSDGERHIYFRTDGGLYSVDSLGVERPILVPETQLHSNPSFDTVAPSTAGIGGTGDVAERDMPTGWTWYWSDPTGTLQSDSSIIGDGGYSLMCTHTAAGVHRIKSSDVTVVPGSLITLSVDAKANKVGAQTRLAIWSGTSASPDYFGSTVQESAWFTIGTAVTRSSSSFLVPATHTHVSIVVYTGYGTTSGTTSVWIDNVRSSMTLQPPSPVITGEIKMWPAASAPDGYLILDGSEQPVATYPTLDALLNTLYGARTNGSGAAGTTHFRLPDFRGRSPVGVGTATGAAGATAKTLAQKGGEETHVLTQAELPANIKGEFAWHGGDGSPAASANGVFGTSPLSANTIRMPGSSSGFQSQTSLKFDLGGSGTSHNNMPPFLGINYIIKT